MLIADRDTILAALTTAGRAATSKGAIYGAPTLRLSSNGRTLTVTGSDPDLTITTTVEVDGDALTVNVPPKLTTDIVRALSDVVTLKDLGDELLIASGRSEFTVRVSATDPPDIPTVDGEPVTLDATALAEGLRQVIPAALADDTRAPQLTGVLFEPLEKGVRLVATDSYRLAIRDIEGVSIGADEGVIIPARALAEVRRLIEDETDAVMITRNDTLARFAVGSTTVTTRLLRGPFPEYVRLVPTEFEGAFTASRSDLAAAIKRVCVVLAAAKDSTTPVRFSPGEGALRLRIVTTDNGTAEDWVAGTLSGDAPNELAFNGRYLLDALDALTGDEATISVIDHTKPAMVRGEDESMRSLIMPVRTS